MGTGMTIFLIIVFVLCVLLLLPIRVKASFGDGKWAVSAYYAFLRVFHKSSEPDNPEPSAEESPAADAPPEDSAPDDDTPDDDTPEAPPSADEPPDEPENAPEPEPEPEDKPKPAAEAPSGETDAADEAESPEDADAADDTDDTDETEDTASEPEKPKKRGFFRRIKPQSVSEAIGLGKDALASLSPALKFLTRHFHFRHVKLYLAVGSDDPANTATLYGKICAGAYNLLAALQCWVDLEADEFRILADFYNDSITFRGALELRVSPAALILTVLILGVRFLWRTWRRFRREDKEEALREQETKPLPEQAAA